MTGLSDGEILAGILCLLDANPDSHPFFAAPAISLPQLANTLHTSPTELDPRRIIDIISPLSETLFPSRRIPFCKTIDTTHGIQDWIVFEEVAKADTKRKSLSLHTSVASPRKQREIPVELQLKPTISVVKTPRPPAPIPVGLSTPLRHQPKYHSSLLPKTKTKAKAKPRRVSVLYELPPTAPIGKTRIANRYFPRDEEEPALEVPEVPKSAGPEFNTFRKKEKIFGGFLKPLLLGRKKKQKGLEGDEERQPSPDSHILKIARNQLPDARQPNGAGEKIAPARQIGEHEVEAAETEEEENATFLEAEPKEEDEAEDSIFDSYFQTSSPSSDRAEKAARSRKPIHTVQLPLHGPTPLPQSPEATGHRNQGELNPGAEVKDETASGGHARSPKMAGAVQSLDVEVFKDGGRATEGMRDEFGDTSEAASAAAQHSSTLTGGNKLKGPATDDTHHEQTGERPGRRESDSPTVEGRESDQSAETSSNQQMGETKAETSTPVASAIPSVPNPQRPSLSIRRGGEGDGYLETHPEHHQEDKPAADRDDNDVRRRARRAERAAAAAATAEGDPNRHASDRDVPVPRSTTDKGRRRERESREARSTQQEIRHESEKVSERPGFPSVPGKSGRERERELRHQERRRQRESASQALTSRTRDKDDERRRHREGLDLHSERERRRDARIRGKLGDDGRSWLVEVCRGLPFGPDVPALAILENAKSRWQLFAAESTVLLAMAYVVQAAGW